MEKNMTPVNSDKYADRKLVIEWRHFDSSGETCDRCYDTGENLNAEIRRLQRKLEPKGILIEFVETKLDDTKVKESNQILMNGVLIEEIIDVEILESFCGSCTDLIGKETFCRMIVFEGEAYDEIPAKAIRQAAMTVLGLDDEDPKTDSTAGCGCGCSGGSCC